MSDIVERLRDRNNPNRAARCVRDDAADEIERLREWQRQMVEKAASGGVLDGYRELAGKLAERDAEIDRLRGQLQVIGDQYAGAVTERDCLRAEVKALRQRCRTYRKAMRDLNRAHAVLWRVIGIRNEDRLSAALAKEERK